MEPDLKYLFFIVGSLLILLGFGYIYGASEVSHESVMIENSNVNIDAFGDLYQIEN